MLKAVLFFLAAITYGVLVNLAKPTLSAWLGDSVIAQWLQMFLILVPMVTLLAFCLQAVNSRPARSESEKLKKTTNRYELLWSGRLPLVESFWYAYVPSAIFFAVGCHYVASRMTAFVGGDVKWAIAALIFVTALLGLCIFGTWRSGDRFRGKRLWVLLSRVSMALGTAAIGLSFFAR